MQPPKQQQYPERDKKENTLDMVQRLFPFKSETELKVYAIASARGDVAPLITQHSLKLVLLAAYTLDEALRLSSQYISSIIGPSVSNWREGIQYVGMPFQQLVPIDKVGEMVRKIEKEKMPPPEEKKEENVSMMEMHARYVFETAAATTFEKGILTGVLNRFRSKFMDINDANK